MLTSWLETWFMFLILFIYSKFSNLNVKTSGSNQVSPEIWSEQCSTGFFSYRTVLIWSLLFLFFFFSKPQKTKLWATSHDILLPHSIPIFSCFFSCWGGGCVCMCVCTFFPLSMHSQKYLCIWKSQVGPFKDVILFILDFLYSDIMMVCSPLEILNSWISVHSIPVSFQKFGKRDTIVAVGHVPWFFFFFLMKDKRNGLWN